MKQLYIIGIAVAVLLLILLGFNKLDNVPRNADTGTPPPAGETQPEPTITNTTPPSMETPSDNTTVVMKTTMGDITIELFTSDMPVTAGNFLKLAQDNFYDSVKFHRVIPGFMVQGGDPLTKDDARAAEWGTGGPGYRIVDEFGPGYSNERGTLSMANAGPNTGGSQFFLNTVNNTFLDGKHPVFGRIVAGMDVVDAISQTPTSGKPLDRPLTPVVILDISIQ